MLPRYVIIIFLILFGYSDYAWSKGARPFDHTKIKVKTSNTSASYDLLRALKWNIAYEKARAQEVKSLLKDINGPALEGLKDEQKKQVLLIMQDVVTKQILEDRDFFRKYLVEQYSEFFTFDELFKLTKYFETALMQMVINAKLESKALTYEQAKTKLKEMNPEERKKIEDMEGSYLYMRYTRFQEKIKPKINQMIADRLKEILGFVIDKMPEIINHVKLNAPVENIKIGTAPSGIQ